MVQRGRVHRQRVAVRKRLNYLLYNQSAVRWRPTVLFIGGLPESFNGVEYIMFKILSVGTGG